MNAMAKPTYLAMQAKTQGNKWFAEKKYEDAARCYTEALAWLPEESSLYCNRSAAWYALDEMEKALDDAIKATEISPRYVKAHYRCALACSAMKGHTSAIARMRRAVELSDRSSREEYKKALLKIESTCSREYLHLNLVGHSETVQEVGWRPLESSSHRPILATCSLDGTIRIWCGDSGIRLHTLRGHTDKVTSIKWTRDGKYLISLALDRTVRVWEVCGDDSVASLHVLHGHKGRATCVCIPDKCDLLVTSSTDCTARIWRDLSSSRDVCEMVLSGHTQMVTCVDFSLRSNVLATASGDKTFRLWDIESGECTQVVDWDCGAVNKCMFVGVGSQNFLVTCHFDVKFERSRLLVWNMDRASGWTDGKLVAHVMHFEGFHGKITCMDTTCTDDGTVLLAAGCSDGTVKVVDMECESSLFDLIDEHIPAVGSSTSITALAFSPDGTRLATSGLDGKIHIWYSEEGTHLMTLSGHEDRICSLQWNSSGTRLASCGNDKTSKTWKTNLF